MSAPIINNIKIADPIDERLFNIDDSIFEYGTFKNIVEISIDTAVPIRSAICDGPDVLSFPKSVTLITKQVINTIIGIKAKIILGFFIS